LVEISSVVFEKKSFKGKVYGWIDGHTRSDHYSSGELKTQDNIMFQLSGTINDL